MEYFKKYFKDVENWEQEEVKVLCPFHDDNNPSASINTSKKVFHCWVCELGLNEEQFLSKTNNMSIQDAIKLLNKYDVNDNWNINIGRLWANKEFVERLNKMGISDKIIEEFKLGIVSTEELVPGKYGYHNMLGIPVFYNNILVDIRGYNLLKNDGLPKLLGKEDGTTGFVIPYDIFLQTKETVYIFEGEKDMLTARELGMNAYTLTGGAGSKPNEYTVNAFKDKKVVICYDNDNAGRDGVIRLYKAIKDLASSVRYVDISEICVENHEDFYDLIYKYKKDILDFYSLEEKEILVETNEERISLKRALDSNRLKVDLRSVVTVIGEFSDMFAVPTIVEFEKGKETNSKSEKMFEGEKTSWFLEKGNIVQMLELIEASAKKTEVLGKIKTFAGIGSEPNVSVKMKEYRTIYKTSITDYRNSINEKVEEEKSPTIMDMYSFNKLDVGGQYVIDYKIYPHPTKHQKQVVICSNNMLVHDSRNYSLNKDILKQFQYNGTIQDKLNLLYNSAKHHIAKHLDYNIWLMSDLVFNSILDFNYGGMIRGALDIFFLGDTHTGKSETTSKLVNLYNFGHFLSLKTSTTVGLIGGSNKVDGSWCNTIGAIPRQHKRLAILEEFSGARQDFIKTMTDIRSSNELRLARASGELVVPCKLRMITLSNPINDDTGNPRFLNTFPNGIMPIMELIKSAEDVARYDGFLLIPKVEKRFNPFEFSLDGEPISKEAYNHKINWIITRQPENVQFDKGIEAYIWERAEELNRKFECNFPVFGVAFSKKLARFCVALAALIVNTDDSYENIIVTKEIVDYTVKYLESNYDNSIFKLKEYTEDYKSYSTFNEKDIEELEKLYAKNATLFDFLNSQSRTTRSNLLSVAGVESSKFYAIFNKLVADKLIRLNVDNVYPTDKFRKLYVRIDKSFTVDTGTIENKEETKYINDLGI